MSDDLEARLRQVLHDEASRIVVGTGSAPTAKDPARRMVAAVAVAVVVALVTGAVVLLRSADHDDGGPLSSIEDLRADNLRSVAWAGDRLFVYMPFGQFPDLANAAGWVDPETGEIAPLPQPPVDGAVQEPGIVATTDLVVMVGPFCGDPEIDVERCQPATTTALVLDRSTGSWHGVDLPEDLDGEVTIEATPLGATEDGRAVFRISTDAGERFWLYEPDGDRLVPLPVPEGQIGDACLGPEGQLVALGREEGTRVLRILPLVGDRREWLTSARTQVAPALDARDVACVGDLALAVDQLGNGIAHEIGSDPATLGLAWRPMATPPAQLDRLYTQRLVAGRELVFLNLSPSRFRSGGDAVAYDAVLDRWRDLPGVPTAGRDLVWSGHAIVGYGQDPDRPGLILDDRLVEVDISVAPPGCPVTFAVRKEGGRVITLLRNAGEESVEVGPQYEVRRDGDVIGYLVQSLDGERGTGGYRAIEDPDLGWDDFGYAIGAGDRFESVFGDAEELRSGDQVATSAFSPCADDGVAVTGVVETAD
jgi:hypothetical protein